MTQDHQVPSSDDRISALENQVSRLESLLAGGAGGEEQQTPSAYDRRSLLRRGGAALAAGAAGAMVLPQLTGTASAAQGDPVQAGLLNTGGLTTTLTRNTATPGAVNDGAPTLVLSNTSGANSGRAGLGSPPLRVAATPLQPDPTTTNSGDFFVQAGSNGVPTQLLFTHESPSGTGPSAIPAAIGSVYTDFLANLFVPVKQDSSARAAHLVLRAGQTGTIDFTGFLAPDGFLIAAMGVLQVGKAQGGNGYVTLYPKGGSRPAVSAITWFYPNDRLSTLSVAIPGDDNQVSVYAALGCDVFFDVVGLLVPSPASVADSHLAPGVAIANSVRAEKLRRQHSARF